MLPEGQPYIGLRPFDTSERHLFFGRDNDARLLSNKVFSASLILLYAPSGVGKTSLLRARLVPDLAEAQAVVLYFDKWANHRPVETLKASLIELADPELQRDLASLSLVDLVGALVKHKGKTIAIVLDQFEQLLLESNDVRRGLASELAALVRSDLDVRVVLSLREELIAALHPIREFIPTLFQSTFRLEHFGDEQAKEAIVEPARIYGAAVEDDLVRAMLADLRTSETIASPDGSSLHRGIELPFLQIICQHLWNESGASETRSLTLESYERVGKRDGIVGAYVKKITEQLDGPTKTDLANLLTFLAPPSGIKRSYTVQDLEAHAGIPRDRTKAVLKHLADCAVVIQRQADAGPAYELSHDAFARVLSPWASDHLSDEKRNAAHRERIRLMRRNVLRVIMGFGCLFLVYLLGRKFEAIRDEWRSTEGVLEALRSDNAQKTPAVDVQAKIDGVVRYLFGRGTADRRRLCDLLKKYEDVIPVTLGLDRPKVSIATAVVEEKWPLTLQYSDKLTLDRDLLQSYWGAAAKEFASEWGIPVPIRLRLIANPRLPSDAIEIQSPRGESATKKIYVPANGEDLFVWRNEIPPDLLQLVQDQGGQWVTYKIEKSDSEALYVPRWSLPLWAHKEVLLRGKEAWIVGNLKEQIKKTPAIIVNEASVAALLKHVLGSSYFARLRESGKTTTILTDELVERFGKGSYLKHAARVLEDLLPERLLADSQASMSGRGSSWPLNRGGVRGFRYLNQTAPYDESLAVLPAQVDVVSVRIRNDQASKLSAVAERLAKVRSDFFERFGLLAPRIEVVAAADLNDDDFRIDLPLDGPNSQIGGRAESSESLEQVVGDRVASVLAEKRVEWLTNTLNAVMGRLPPGLSGRLEGYFNTSELMSALRGVFAETVQSGPAETIALPSWLLGSLVFFKTVDPRLEPKAVGDLLRRVQAARLDSTADVPADPRMSKGIDALVKDEVQEAEGIFKLYQRKHGDKGEQFLRLYAQRSLAMEVDHILSENSCDRPSLDDLPRMSPRSKDDDADARGDSRKDPGAPRRDKSLAVADEYTLTTMHALVDDKRIDRRQRLKLGICMWSHFFREEVIDGRRTPFDLLQLLSDESFVETVLVVHLILAAHDSSLPPDHLPEIRERLAKALPRLEGSDAIWAFSDLDGLCRRVKDPVWCNEMITMFTTTAEQPNPAMLRLVGQRLIGSPKLPQDIDRALALLDQADQLGPAPDDDAMLARAEGHIYRARYEKVDLQDVAQKVDAMLAKPTDPLAILLVDHRSRLYELRGLIKLMSNDPAGAEQVVKVGIEELKATAGLMGVQLLTLLETAQAYGITEWFNTDAAVIGDADVQFQRAFASLVTDNPEAEFRARDLFATSHEYRDYIRLMLWAWLTAHGEKIKAQHLLSDRMKTIDVEKWDERLRQGDPTPWREKLIAYYSGKLERKDFFAPLESEESFRSSPLSGIGLPLQNLRCEAYFYDAWLRRAQGSSTEFRRSLEQVRAAAAPGMFEYHAARYLLSKLDEEALRAAR